MTEREFTLEELSRYNGRSGGSRVYIAYEGKVYDVSSSYLWREGKHWARHWAGADLTDELPDAPHTARLLEKFPIIGILAKKRS